MLSFYYDRIFPLRPKAFLPFTLLLSFISISRSPALHCCCNQYSEDLLESRLWEEAERWGRWDVGKEGSAFQALPPQCEPPTQLSHCVLGAGQGWELWAEAKRVSRFTNLGRAATQNPSSFLPHTHLCISRKKKRRKIQYLSLGPRTLWFLSRNPRDLVSMTFISGYSNSVGEWRLSTIFM